MDQFSEKVYLRLTMPTEEVPVSDEKRMRLALESMGYQPVSIPLAVLRRLYPLCRKANFDITVTLVHRDHDWVLTHVEAGDTRQHHYGLAVDYGSTTIIMQLVDLNSGAVVGEVKAVNSQSAYGSDILSRITYAMEDPSHADDLHRATVETLETLLDRLTENTGINAKQSPLMILSGNTTMIHFLLKLDGWTVFASPYAPVTSDPGFFWGTELEMDFEGLIYIIPAASNYVGGDIVSGLLVTDLHRKEETSLFSTSAPTASWSSAAGTGFWPVPVRQVRRWRAISAVSVCGQGRVPLIPCGSRAASFLIPPSETGSLWASAAPASSICWRRCD